MYDVVILGGGSSGMMAAVVAGEAGKKVLLIEKNKHLGEKLKITGGGRCNITNAEPDVHKLLANYGKGAPFLYAPFARFGMKDTFTFFESRGLPLVVQARNRAFPASEKALDVFLTLEKSLKKAGVTVVTGAPITRVVHKGTKVVSVYAGTQEFTGKSFIFATGGLSHPETGSTGDGFAFLKRVGHTVIEPTPTVVPLAVADAWVHALAGVSLSFMKITFFVGRMKTFTKKGKILFTHFGLSGPLILNSAVQVGDLLARGTVTATIDCYPDTDLGALDDKVIKIFDSTKNKMLKNVLGDIVPEGMTEAVLTLLAEEVDGDTKVHSVTVAMRKKLVHLLKALPLTVTGLMGYDRAVVSDGGIPLTEIDTRTMQSLKMDNVFITGDLLHINRPSGGFSLQLCWTTGYVAGSNA